MYDKSAMGQINRDKPANMIIIFPDQYLIARYSIQDLHLPTMDASKVLSPSTIKWILLEIDSLVKNKRTLYKYMVQLSYTSFLQI